MRGRRHMGGTWVACVMSLGAERGASTRSRPAQQGMLHRAGLGVGMLSAVGYAKLGHLHTWQEDVRVPFLMRGPLVPRGVVSDYQVRACVWGGWGGGQGGGGAQHGFQSISPLVCQGRCRPLAVLSLSALWLSVKVVDPPSEGAAATKWYRGIDWMHSGGQTQRPTTHASLARLGAWCRCGWCGCGWCRCGAVPVQARVYALAADRNYGTQQQSRSTF